MKPFYIISLLLYLSTFPATADKGNPALSEYLRGCRLMTEAIKSHDKLQLQKAIECFDNADASPGEISSVKRDGAECKPEYLFTADFADELLLNEFSLAKLDPETLMRTGNPDSVLSLYHIYLAPGESATLEFEGSDEMNVSVSSGGMAQASLEIFDSINDFNKTASTSEKNDSASISWDMLNPASVRAVIKNITNKGATFVVIFN